MQTQSHTWHVFVVCMCGSVAANSLLDCPGGLTDVFVSLCANGALEYVNYIPGVAI